GFTGTRYQGDEVLFNAATREITLIGDAAVARGSTILVGDTIVYNDSTRMVLAMGDTVILRDPAQGAADLIVEGRMTYDLVNRRGTFTNLRTAVEEEQRWFVFGEHFTFVSDTAGEGRTTSYALEGSITSCDLRTPHYHFQAREIKHVSKRWIIARPAVLYIADIPVFWLPFIFQDLRSGRRSGMLPMRFGLTDIVRTSPSYRRQIENIGYYFAINDFTDAELSMDWRSGARATDEDPGWMRYNGEFRYRWLDRFLSGRLATSYTSYSTEGNNLALSLSHQQDFSMRSHLTANINYVSNTRIQRQQSFLVAQQLSTIHSSLAYQQQLGPANLSIGGSRRQYPGREQVDQDFPNFSITTKPISPAPWFVWTPQLSVSNSQGFNLDQGGGFLAFRYFLTPQGALDSTRVKRDTRNSRADFQTPIRIFGFTWRNSFSVSDVEHDFPEQRTIYGVNDSSRIERVYDRTYLTTVNWETGVELPRIASGKWNIVPSISITNVDPAGFLVRSERTGGEYVSQSKRLTYGLSVSPTFFGLFPGFGPFSRLRHSISPSLSFNYAPAGDVSDEFLQALGRTRIGYLGALRQNAVTLSLTQNIEAKVRSRSDTNPDAGEKIRLLSLNFSPITYDFERARATGRTGLTTSTFSWSARSDLLPGFDLSFGYSLFEGNPLSDSARFKPFRETISASLSIGRGRNPFATLTRLFGGAVPPDSATLPAASQAGQGPIVRGQSPLVAGGSSARIPLGISNTAGWEASLNFSSSRRRPPVGGDVIEVDPTLICRELDPILQPACEAQQRQLALSDTITSTTEGAVYTRLPPTSTLRGSFTFGLTPNWAVQWATGYDFERSEFSDHVVTLQRQMHDWRAIFAFTQAPNGNFAFNFFISLIAEPDLKFDFNRRTYRPPAP
ncbi:MAG: putative LPS assembly protein LptD, partial [Gemmatimonadaceae bacterium]